MSTTSRDMADINLAEEEEEEEVEQHSWGHRPGPGSGGDCIAAISTCQSVSLGGCNLVNILLGLGYYIERQFIDQKSDRNTELSSPSCGRNFLQKAHCLTLIPSMILKIFQFSDENIFKIFWLKIF